MSSSDQLLLVQAAIRHADRAPIQRFLNDKSKEIYYRGLGELSDEGLDNAAQLGAIFKKRYIDTGFVDRRMIPGQVYIRSSATNRTLMSANAFASTLFDRTPQGTPRLPPVFSVDQHHDNMLVAMVLSPEMHDYAREKWGLELPTSDDVNYGLKMGQLFAKVNGAETAEIIKNLPHKNTEAILVESANSQTDLLPAERDALPAIKKQAFRAMSFAAGAPPFFNPPQLRRMAGELTEELLRNINSAAESKVDDKKKKDQAAMLIYYTHDMNLVALSEILGFHDVFSEEGVAFSAAIVFELWRGERGDYIKIFVKNGIPEPFELVRSTDFGVDELASIKDKILKKEAIKTVDVNANDEL